MIFAVVILQSGQSAFTSACESVRESVEDRICGDVLDHGIALAVRVGDEEVTDDLAHVRVALVSVGVDDHGRLHGDRIHRREDPLRAALLHLLDQRRCQGDTRLGDVVGVLGERRVDSGAERRRVRGVIAHQRIIPVHQAGELLQRLLKLDVRRVVRREHHHRLRAGWGRLEWRGDSDLGGSGLPRLQVGRGLRHAGAAGCGARVRRRAAG